MQLVLIMEYIAGGSLSDFIHERAQDPEKKRKLIERHRVQILRDILDGMEMLHAKNYVHRDLKPANVVLGPGLRAKVCQG